MQINHNIGNGIFIVYISGIVAMAMMAFIENRVHHIPTCWIRVNRYGNCCIYYDNNMVIFTVMAIHKYSMHEPLKTLIRDAIDLNMCDYTKYKIMR